MEAHGRVEGSASGGNRVQFYGLSTCIWCRKARALLEEIGASFDYAYVDLLVGSERDAALAELARLGRGETFPTLVIDGDTCIVGFRPDEIRKAFGR